MAVARSGMGPPDGLARPVERSGGRGRNRRPWSRRSDQSPASPWIAEPPAVSAAEWAELAAFPSTLVADVVGPECALHPRIRCLTATARLLGEALPVEAPPGDNLFLLCALAMVQPGQVLVVTAQRDGRRAVWGGNLMAALAARGGYGLVVDGYVRDQDELEASGLPVFALGTCSTPPTRNGPGRIGYAAWCGDRWVEAGDVLVGDRDGVVVIPRRELAPVRAALPAAAQAGQERAAALRRGEIPEAVFAAVRQHGWE